ncbi:MAG: 4-alpha-glucanotransferase [Nitrospira sp.]|nr:4-alpha-glucanotransferase [Nitrospira sp.]
MYDAPESELLRLLADRAGIATDYYDIAGTLHVTTDETRRAILAAMNFRVESRAELIDALTAWDHRPWMQGCDPVRILRQGEAPGRWLLHVPCESHEESVIRVRWWLVSESGERSHEREEGPGLKVEEVRVVAGRRFMRTEFTLPHALPLGYYSAHVQVQGGSVELATGFRVIVAPAGCFVPEWFERGTRLWGIALQLYSLRSDRNWGVGDFQDLSAVVEWAGTQLGASVIGLNPLHALKNTTPYHISPYSPTSRLFLNELYIDVEQVEECRTDPTVRACLADATFRARLDAARRSEFVEYEAVAAAKRTVLGLCAQAFARENFEGGDPDRSPTTERGRVFQEYVRQEGEPLAHYALFRVLEDEQQREPSSPEVWMDWPEPYRDPSSAAVGEFRRRHTRQIHAIQYVQWLAHGQLRALVDKAGQAGMPIGLYYDLALGSDRAGADGWRFQPVLAMKADCGAPPDAFAPDGQNWGFSPADPLRLRASGYEYLIELLRRNFRYGGAIRLDHVMALFRLFWIPRGLPASKGTYVHYPADDLLAILALESVRAKVLVIGEDLGTVPDWVRQRLGTAGVLSYRVFYFERTWEGGWKPPGAYPSQSLAVAATHDLPTLTGYWDGADIETRAELGFFSSVETKMSALAERQREKAAIMAALRSEGLWPPGLPGNAAHGPAMTWELARAIHVYLARTPAWLVLANVEDVIGARAQTNVPGTVDEHPNWRRKLIPTVEELIRDDRFKQLAAELRSLRPLV